MAKLSAKVGTTSKIFRVFAQDSSATTGAGLTGLVYNSSGLTAYYIIEGVASPVAISLVTATAGTWTSGGFVEVSSANMPGVYEIHVPNLALASGKSVLIMLKGATNLAPILLEIELTAVDNQSATAFITGVNSLAPPVGWNTLTISSNSVYSLVNGYNFHQDPLYNITNGTQALVLDANGRVNVGKWFDQTVSVDTNNAPNVSAKWWAGGLIPAVNVTGVPLVDVKYVKGTLSPAQAGYFAPDWSQVVNPGSTVTLSATTIGTATTVTGGATSASQTSILNAVNAITTNTARGRLILPYWLVRPASGSVVYEIDLNIYSLQGQLEAPDAAPTIHARNSAGASLDASLGSTTMTLISTGKYKVTYTVASTDTAQEVLFDATYTVGAVAFAVSDATEVQDAEIIATLNAIKAKTDNLPSSAANSAGGLPTIGSGTGQITLTSGFVSVHAFDVTAQGQLQSLLLANTPAFDANGNVYISSATNTGAVQMPTVAAIDTQLSGTHGSGAWTGGGGGGGTTEITETILDASEVTSP